MPRAASMLSSNRPAWPTKGSPLASSSAPGASPTKSHCACASPTPGTDLLRVLHKPHAVHASTSRAKSLHSSVAMRRKRSLAEAGNSWVGRAAGATVEGTEFSRGDAGVGARRRHIGSNPSSRRISERSTTLVCGKCATHHERILAFATGPRWVVRDAARDRHERFGGVEGYRRRVRHPNFEKTLRRTALPCIG